MASVYDQEKKKTVVQPGQQVQQVQQQAAGAPQYASVKQPRLNELYDKIMSRPKFNYDLNGDMLYQNYKDQYQLGGQQAMMDTMGQAAALTGGYGNSYASTAGNQAYQQYLTQLNAMIPELAGNARELYAIEGNDLMNQYSVADSDREYSGNIAMALLNNGQMPSEQLLMAAGLSNEDAQAFLDAWAAANTPAVSGTRNTDQKPTGNDGTLDADQLKLKLAAEMGNAMKTNNTVNSTPGMVAGAALGNGKSFIDNVKDTASSYLAANGAAMSKAAQEALKKLLAKQ